MEELIFFAVIIAFTIIDSIARSRKKKQQAGTTTPLPEATAEWEWEAELPTYDTDPSYDDEEEEEELPAGPRRIGTSSEAMIPSDIWEEIAGLAQGRPSEPPPPVRAPEPARPARTPRPAPQPRAVPQHRVHLAHRDYGTDPSTRPASEQDGLDPLAVTLSADASAVRRQLRSRGSHALRQAIILQEVLGPPAATRRERFGPDE